MHSTVVIGSNMEVDLSSEGCEEFEYGIHGQESGLHSLNLSGRKDFMSVT